MSCPHTQKKMFIVTLFIIATYWKQPKYPYAGEMINILQYIKKVNYYSTIAKKERLIHATT